MFQCIDPRRKTFSSTTLQLTSYHATHRMTITKIFPSSLCVSSWRSEKKIRPYRIKVLSTPRWSSRYYQVVPSAALAEWKTQSFFFFPWKSIVRRTILLSFFHHLWCEEKKSMKELSWLEDCAKVCKVWLQRFRWLSSVENSSLLAVIKRWIRGLVDDYIVLSQQYCLSFAFCCCFGTFVLFAKRNGQQTSRLRKRIKISLLAPQLSPTISDSFL